MTRAEILRRRAALSLLGFVMPAGHRERQVLRRMQARGEAFPALGLPDCWVVMPARHPSGCACVGGNGCDR